jgi:hypothetical protein
MKPVSHTSSPTTSVGAPWEIKRLQLSSSGRWVDFYTKDGKLGAYASYLVLIPDYDVGFTVLAAGFSANADVLVGLAVDAYFEALEDAARLQSAPVLAGKYVAKGEEVNSSFSLTSEVTSPGLGLVDWVSNGTAFLEVFPIFISLAEGNFEAAAEELGLLQNGTILIDPADVSVRLYPTTLRTPISGGGERVSYRAVFEVVSNATDPDPIPDSTSAWIIADAIVYGKSGADEFIFSLDGKGNVVSVEYPFARQTFVKV